MAYTLGQLVTDVRNKLDDSSFSSTLIKEYINDTQRYIVNRHQLKYMEASYSQALTIDDFSYDLQADVGTVSTLRITDENGKDHDITGNYLNYIEFDNKHPDPADDTSGLPDEWTIRDDALLLYPKPDFAYTLVIRYQKDPTELSADADVPDVPVRFKELLVLGALYRCHKFNDNYDMASFERSEFDEQLLNIVAKNYTRQNGRPHIMRVNGRRV